MNKIDNKDKSLFLRKLLNLPPTLKEVLYNIQNPNKPLPGGTLNIGTFNQDLLQNQKVLSSLFEETPQINLETLADNVQPKIQNAKQQEFFVLFNGMINIADVSKLILQNSKQAIAALIIAMAQSSKQGINNEQIQETLSILNNCISMAESNTPTQNLKSLMLLYIPWLPLNENINFDLEITPQEGENESTNSKLIVLIQTKNFGNLKAELILTTSNSINIFITCSENFPKNILEKLLEEESSSHAMSTNVDIESVQSIHDQNTTAEAKVNLSATNEMNPYLLLMAHSFIRNVISIDNNANQYK